MVSIDNKLSKYAAEIVKQLDSMDGENGKISANIWNERFNAKSKKGAEIRNYITTENAEKAIIRYFQKNISAGNGDIDSIGKQWLQDISEPEQKPTAAPPKQTSGRLTLTMADTKPVEKKDASGFGFDLNNNSIFPQDDKSQFAYILDKYRLFSFTQEDAIDYTQFEKLAQTTKSSSAKASEIPIEENLLDMAFDNEINRLMKKGGKSKSVLTGTAKDFIKYAKQYNVDVFTLMGISMIESSYGTSKMALEKNNIGGLTPNGRDGINCTSIADSINIAAKTLHKNIYIKGLDSIDSVGTKGNYCCADEKGRNNWVRSVTIFANSLRKEYNRLLQEAQNTEANA